LFATNRNLRKILTNKVQTTTVNVPRVCKYLLHACTKGEVGCTYQAWTSVVFLLYSGIAKPSVSVKDKWISRFSLVYTIKPLLYTSNPRRSKRGTQNLTIMKKKLFTLLLAIVASIGLTRGADVWGTCGDALVWSLTFDDSTLVVSPHPDIIGPIDEKELTMHDWTVEEPAPWHQYWYFIAHVIIGEGIPNIGNYAFYDCPGLNTIDIPKSLKYIGEEAFTQCDYMHRVIINDLAAWCDITFSGPHSNPLSYAHHLYQRYVYTNEYTDLVIIKEIKKLVIPDSKQSINDYAFKRCLGFTSVTIPNSVTSIGKSAFESCVYLESATIPESVTSIADSAFSSCYSLISVTLPNSVTSIGENAFSMVPNIAYSGTATGSPWGARCMNGFVEGQLVYNDASKTVLRACPANVYGTQHIANSVESIADYAFFLCSGLESVTIPNGVTSIGNYAFALCGNLESVTIPGSVTKIGDRAFYNCVSLGLDNVVNYAATPQTINSDVFEGVNLANHRILRVPYESVELYKDAAVWKEFEFIWPISATQTTMEDDEVAITPEFYSVDITWPPVPSASVYSLTVKDKDGNTICVMAFNGSGLLTSLAYAAPSRTQTATQVTGFTFTVTGLDSGSEYTYSIVAKDSQDQVLDTKEGSFTTSGGTPTAVDNASVDTKPVKVIRHGQLYILRDGKTFTLQGQELR